MVTLLHGGQTGVDRGAHEAAIDCGWSVAGYMPRDERDERGPIPAEVARHLVPHATTSYAARTRANVSVASLLLVVVRDAADPRATPGTAMTIDFADERRLRRMVVDPTTDARTIAHWLGSSLTEVQMPLLLEPTPEPRVRLLVAGPRESKWPGACAETSALLRHVARLLAEITPRSSVLRPNRSGEM